jgi:hypothetical protein
MLKRPSRWRLAAEPGTPSESGGSDTRALLWFPVQSAGDFYLGFYRVALYI